MMIRLLLASAVFGAAAIATAPTPAQKKIELAQRAVAARPESVQGYADLAFAYAKRARETADPAYYTKAQEALERCFKLEPGNFTAQKLEVWLLLGKHEFAAALEKAKALNRRAPDDVTVYGFLADAHVELGNYDQAEEAVQWMLNLRPGNVAALTRTSYLRELFGDLDGAVDAMRMALQSTSPSESEDRAWMLTHIGHLRHAQNRLEDASRVLGQALELFPDYHYALGALALVRAAQGRHEDAVRLMHKRYEQAPHPENLYALARALDEAGMKARAAQAFQKFEKEALAESEGADNSNRELVLYFVEQARKPAEALRVAKMEMNRRQDVHTLDMYAWALHANGQTEDARIYLERALKVGVQDREMLARAAIIRGAGGADSEAGGGATPE